MSGANVAFVLAVVGPVLRRFGIHARVAGSLGVLAVFGTMTRWEPSVVRACAMTACSMLALSLGRPTAGLRVLALAVLALLLVDPFLLWSIGFLLSCGATAGIALLAAPLSARLRGPPWVCDSMAVTLAAQIGVAPVLLPVFGSVPLVAIPANLVAVPLAAPLTIWGLVSGAAGGMLGGWSPELAALLQVPTQLLARAVRAVATVAARVPVEIDPKAAFSITVATGLVAAGRRMTSRRASTLRTDAVVPAR